MFYFLVQCKRKKTYTFDVQKYIFYIRLDQPTVVLTFFHCQHWQFNYCYCLKVQCVGFSGLWLWGCRPPCPQFIFKHYITFLQMGSARFHYWIRCRMIHRCRSPSLSLSGFRQQAGGGTAPPSPAAAAAREARQQEELLLHQRRGAPHRPGEPALAA